MATTLLREGLTLARQMPSPDLVLLNTELPDGSGLAFFDTCTRCARAVQCQPDLRPLPIIVMADYVDRDLNRQLKAIAADYFVKPISRRNLLDRVNRVAARK